jgi:hypothetical protein
LRFARQAAATLNLFGLRPPGWCSARAPFTEEFAWPDFWIFHPMKKLELSARNLFWPLTAYFLSRRSVSPVVDADLLAQTRKVMLANLSK